MTEHFRTCRHCNQSKRLSEFANAGRSNGVQYRRWLCVKCYSKRKYEVRINNRKKLDEYRGGLKCQQCGIDDHRVMEFHHRDPSKKDNSISSMLTHSWKRIVREIEKCDVLCANCHRILHYEERESKKAED